LQTEGIPLLLGIDPDNDKSGVATEDREAEINELWQHARHCVEHDLLSVMNPEHPPTEWRVVPAVLYQWASISRISMPPAFVNLIEFVVQTIKRTKLHENNTSISEPDLKQEKAYKILEHQKIVLGAAMALLGNRHVACINRNGKVNVTNVVNQIIEDEEIWFGEDKPLISHSAMQDLIKKYLNSISYKTEDTI